MKKLSYLLLFLLSLIWMNEKTTAQTLLLNEIYSRGVTADPDWIEVYNPTSTSIDLTGYKIYDVGGQSGTKPKKLFTSGLIIPAKGFVVVVVDVADSSGFGLSSSGEKVWLENPTGTIIDSIAFPALGTDTSYGRKPDGTASWQKLTPLTKGASNGGSLFGTSMVMNEIYSRGTTAEPDWVEFYNPLSTPLDISGWKIYDIGGQSGTKPKNTAPAGTIIAAKGFLVVTVDTPDSSGFGLSSGGETLWIENASGVIMDSVAFPALTVTQSYSRVPDGGPWKISEVITKGFANGTTGLTGDVFANLNFAVEQNYPNPFNPATAINYTIPTSQHIRITVHDMLGRELVCLFEGEQSAGNHTVQFDASAYSSGVYLYTIAGQRQSVSRKMLLIK